MIMVLGGVGYGLYVEGLLLLGTKKRQPMTGCPGWIFFFLQQFA